MRKTKAEAAATRVSVLRCALQVFSAKGYGATTLEDIAREAGVTRGAIYWHFKNKADLYTALVQEVSSRSDTVVAQAIAEGGPFLTICRRVFLRLLDYLQTDAEYRAVTELALFKTERLAELETGMQLRVAAGRVVLANIAAFMRLGIEQGEVRPNLDPIEAARAFIALQNGVAALWLTDMQMLPLHTSAPALADIFIRGIAAHPVP